MGPTETYVNCMVYYAILLCNAKTKQLNSMDQLNLLPNPKTKTIQDISNTILSLNSNIHLVIESSFNVVSRSNYSKIPPETTRENAEKNYFWRKCKLNQFIDYISPNINFIYKLNENFLNSALALHPITDSNSPLFATVDKTEISVDSLRSNSRPT